MFSANLTKCDNCQGKGCEKCNDVGFFANNKENINDWIWFIKFWSS